LAFLPAVLFGWTIETVPVESFSPGSWLRSLAFAATAAAAPIVCAAACAAGRPLPAFSSLVGRTGQHRDALHWVLGGSLVALMLLSVETALGLVFDPRYRDMPFAPLGAAVVPFAVVMLSTPRPAGSRARAETLAACVLAASAAYIVFDESFANWQSVWFCAGMIGLAFILARARDAPG
jgi:glucan 1,3-beta-glucosidase